MKVNQTLSKSEQIALVKLLDVAQLLKTENRRFLSQGAVEMVMSDVGNAVDGFVDAVKAGRGEF